MDDDDHRCYIIPPHLLKAMSESKHLARPHREAAKAMLEESEQYMAARKEHFEALAQPQSIRNRASRGQASQQTTQQTSQSQQNSQQTTQQNSSSQPHLQQNSQSQPTFEQPPQDAPSIVAPHVLSGLANSSQVDQQTRAGAQSDLVHRGVVLDQPRQEQQPLTAPRPAAAADVAKRSVYTLNNSQNMLELPGTLVREEGQDSVQDKAVNEVYDNIGHVLEAYKKFFDWESIDNSNQAIMSTVHFGKSYQNAYWDPRREQMVFGDGGEFLGNFTTAVDVIGHELTHAITSKTTPLIYLGQPGALNEHISDVFGSIVKQWRQDEDSAKADWLVGEECLLPGVKGVALRSMKAPGTAYDDPKFGKDPQPNHYKHYRPMLEDNGGVHIYSGIPNKAYYLASVAFGGYSWEKAGQIWWRTMTGGYIGPRCTFLQFAEATVQAAEDEFDADAAKVVRKAWEDVGLAPRKGLFDGWCMSGLR